MAAVYWYYGFEIAYLEFNIEIGNANEDTAFQVNRIRSSGADDHLGEIINSMQTPQVPLLAPIPSIVHHQMPIDTQYNIESVIRWSSVDMVIVCVSIIQCTSAIGSDAN